MFPWTYTNYFYYKIFISFKTSLANESNVDVVFSKDFFNFVYDFFGRSCVPGLGRGQHDPEEILKDT